MNEDIIEKLKYYHIRLADYCAGRKCEDCKHGKYTRSSCRPFSCFIFDICVELLGDSMSKKEIALWLTDYHKQCEAYCKKHIDLKNKCPTCAISELYYYTRYDCFDCFVATQLFKDV